MPPVSALSDAATKLRKLIADRIEDLPVENIKIGHPKDTFPDLEKDTSSNWLNLFLYNISYDGYPADGTSEDPFYVRLYCLLTPFGSVDNSNSLSAGESDLRLMGEVMRVLHENPVISVDNSEKEKIAELQMVLHPLNLDNLNHIWSTQTDTAYRLSVAYEMALAPIPLAKAVERSPLVGDPQEVYWGKMDRPQEKEKNGLISLKPLVEYLEIDTDRDDWMPHICLVEPVNGDKRLHYVFKVEGDLSRELDILLAGRNNGKVKLFWNVWRRKKDNSIVAWKENIPDSANPAGVEIKNVPGSTTPFFPNRIDPNDIDSRRTFKAELPADVRKNDTKTWQASLCAIYEWSHEKPVGSGEVVITLIKSNSVLCYGEGS